MAESKRDGLKLSNEGTILGLQEKTKEYIKLLLEK